MRAALRLLDRALAAALLLAVRAYQWTLSPLMGGQCRFRPTCSRYSVDALRAHGGVRGAWLTARRLARCHPWGGSGWDPAPETSADGAPKV